MIAVEVGRSDRGLLVIGVGVGDVVVGVNLDVAVDVNTLMSMRKYVVLLATIQNFELDPFRASALYLSPPLLSTPALGFLSYMHHTIASAVHCNQP